MITSYSVPSSPTNGISPTVEREAASFNSRRDIYIRLAWTNSCTELVTHHRAANMPLWVIYHPEGIFPTSSSKQFLANVITLLYTSIGLPAFYVVVNFVPLPPGNIFMGGKNPPASRPFARFVVDHVAITSRARRA